MGSLSRHLERYSPERSCPSRDSRDLAVRISIDESLFGGRGRQRQFATVVGPNTFKICHSEFYAASKLRPPTCVSGYGMRSARRYEHDGWVQSFLILPSIEKQLVMRRCGTWARKSSYSLSIYPPTYLSVYTTAFYTFDAQATRGSTRFLSSETAGRREACGGK
jgi:hypothetical protein